MATAVRLPIQLCRGSAQVDADTPAFQRRSQSPPAAGSARQAGGVRGAPGYLREGGRRGLHRAAATASLTAIRRQLLTGFERPPIAGEYIRDAYDIGERYGKDSFLLIDRLGTSRVPAAFALKAVSMAGFEKRFACGVTDRDAGADGRSHLPKRMGGSPAHAEHHLPLKVSAQDAAQTEAWLRDFFAGHEGRYFHCTAEEGGRSCIALPWPQCYREVHRDQVGHRRAGHRAAT